jgi:capsular polysaccharide transport system permease protein
VTTTSQTSGPTSKEIARGEARQRVFRLMAFAVLGPTLASAVYFAVIAPPEYKATAEYTIRGRLQPAPQLLAGLGLAGAQNTFNDAYAVIDYLQSAKTIDLLRAKYRFNESYSRFTLDPTAYLSPKTPMEWVTRFWTRKFKGEYDANNNTTTITVAAYTPQDALRLAQGVLQAGTNVVDVLNAEVQKGSLVQAMQQVAKAKADYDESKRQLSELEGKVNALTYTIPTQEAEAEVTSIDSSLAQLNVNLGTASALYKPSAPQTKAIQSQIATLQAARARAMAKAKAAPGQAAAAHDVMIAAAQNDLQFAEKTYLTAQANLVAAQPENQDKDFVVVFMPPRLPEQSDYWERFLYVIAVFVASTVFFGIAGLSYSVIKDHIQ